ncbi:hypothetical protein PFISCL1PPCAC_25543 [Pristionchus fissidentatus]|uniref:BTB domain-containing protein n=1 Tax=Pristionchus fissidentatus TaxID=1538716 RepID=A0AAV5WPP2_9BILA|nr:hypothetical protein PFISCL1PPCAC_25543 [Pristionchus fissidentatus]
MFIIKTKQKLSMKLFLVQILSSLLLPIRSPSSLVSLRIDPWMSLIFEDDVTMVTNGTSDVKKLADCDLYKNLTKFSLTIDPFLAGVHTDDSLLTEIYSDILKIGSTTIAVSRELLSLHSDFFSNLFYGQFMERNQEVKEIKDIPEPEFVDFLQSIHRRRFEFASVRSALDTMGFADRLLMSRISKEILPYLINQSLPEDLLEYALTVADRVPCDEEILAWILSQFPSKTKLLEILHTLLPSISAATAQMCLEVGLQHISELEKIVAEPKEPDYVKMSKLMANRYNTAGIHLLCYDWTRKIVEMEDYFQAPFRRQELYDDQIHDYVAKSYAYDIWTYIPHHYSTAIVNGVTYNRNSAVLVSTENDGYPTSVVKLQAYGN